MLGTKLVETLTERSWLQKWKLFDDPSRYGRLVGKFELSHGHEAKDSLCSKLCGLDFRGSKNIHLEVVILILCYEVLFWSWSPLQFSWVTFRSLGC